MGSSNAPYLYDPHASSRQSVAYPYSDFNPRAATQRHYAELAARAERHKARAQHGDRPLISFNQHPDSYLVIGAKPSEHKPLSPNTKKAIKAVRWVQLSFRCLEEIAAIGLLVVVICLKMPMDAVGWILRIAPAYDILVTMYAIYHLARPAKGRPPTSSASYHLFAMMMDTGLIPFYVFTAICADQSYYEAAGTAGRWTSYFNTQTATNTLMIVTFLVAIILGGFHLISIGLDIYLVIVFRKIANLPPDMNPLEDNLTSRKTRSKRHKHKTSSLTSASNISVDMKEKHHLSVESIPSTSGVVRTAAGKDATEVRAMPFMHSRMGSSISFSPHNPDSARLSRQALGENRFASSSPVNHLSQAYRSDATPRPTSTVSSQPHPELRPAPLRRFSGSGNWISSAPAKESWVQQNAAYASQSPVLDSGSRQQGESLLGNSNWYSLENDDENADMGTRRLNNRKAYAAVPANYDDAEEEHEEPTYSHHERHDSFEPQPLKMNPPTPPLPEGDRPRSVAALRPHHAAKGSRDVPSPHQHQHNPRDQQQLQQDHAHGISRNVTAASQKTYTSSVYSDSASSLGGSKSRVDNDNTTPKSKYYGDLTAATRGVRRAGAMSPEGGFYNLPPSPDPNAEHGVGGGGRVVSRTGVDLADARMGYGGVGGGEQPLAIGASGVRDRRQASGKMAEEGRAGAWERRMY